MSKEKSVDSGVSDTSVSMPQGRYVRTVACWEWTPSQFREWIARGAVATAVRETEMAIVKLTYPT